MTPPLADPRASQAVLIGVHSFKHLDNLPAVANNLTALKDTFGDPEIWGLPPEHIVEVHQPADSDLLDAVIDAGKKATDTLLVYYAGHGLADDQTDELYLTLPHTAPHRPDTAFRYDFLRRHLTAPEMRARHVVVILDCCWSGRALPGGMAAGEVLADHAALPGARCVLAASAATKIALAPPGETYTAFTGVLLDILSEGIPGSSDPLDVQSLYVRAHSVLSGQSRPLPELGSRGDASTVCIARNLSPKRLKTPMSPPAQLAQTAAAAGATTPTPPPVRRPAGIPIRMPALVRERLARHPQPRRLYVTGTATPEPRQLRKAREEHRLDDWEDLIGAWFWGLGLLSNHCMAFTTRGIRISNKPQPIFIAYTDIDAYTFESRSEYSTYGRNGSYDTWLAITGPQRWNSLAGVSVSMLDGMAEILNDIKALAAG